MTLFKVNVCYALAAMLTLMLGANAQESTMTEMTTHTIWLNPGSASSTINFPGLDTLVTSKKSPTSTVTEPVVIVVSPVITTTIVMAMPTTIVTTLTTLAPSLLSVNYTTNLKPTVSTIASSQNWNSSISTSSVPIQSAASASTGTAPSGTKLNSTTRTTSWTKQSATAVSSLALPSSTSSSVTHKPSKCGESGYFTLGWDDEPSFEPTDPSSTHFPPMFNPYHHLFFSNGYVYAPPPNEPFQPVSPPNLAVFLPNVSSEDTGSPDAGDVVSGGLGAGPRASSSTFWFDAYSAFVGCENAGPDDCLIMVQGLAWNEVMEEEVLIVEQDVIVPPCPRLVDCQLLPIVLDKEFVSLSGLSINAIASDWSGDITPRTFYMDNLSLAWSNNSCEAGLERQMSRK